MTIVSRLVLLLLAALLALAPITAAHAEPFECPPDCRSPTDMSGSGSGGSSK